MERRKYKTVTVSRRVKVKNLNFINGNLADITYKTRKRINPVKVEKVDPKPTPSANSNFGISENDHMFYRAEGKFWVCPLSEQEQTFVRAILSAKDGVLDGDEAFKVLKLQYWDTQKMKHFIGNINRKLKENKIPVKISTANHQYRFVKR